MFYSDNTFVNMYPEPLMKLKPSSLASMRNLQIILAPLRGCYEHLCDNFYPWEDDRGSLRPERRRAILDTWQTLASFIGRGISQEKYRLHLSLLCDCTNFAPEGVACWTLVGRFSERVGRRRDFRCY